MKLVGYFVALIDECLRLSYGRHAKCSFFPAQLRTKVRSIAYQSSMLTSRLIELIGKENRISRYLWILNLRKGRARSPSEPISECFNHLSFPIGLRIHSWEEFL